jgi:stage II sporulation protein D
MTRLLLGLLALSLAAAPLRAQKVSVGLLFDTPVRTATLTAQRGSYAIIVNDTLLITALSERGSLIVSANGSRLRLRADGQELGLFASVKAVAMDKGGAFALGCAPLRGGPRRYAQDATFVSERDGSGIRIVNQLEEPAYLCGVVEAETGCGAQPEFYRAQSILSRTYLYAHFSRHAKDGFNLCDGVHCQAYQGLLSRCQRVRTAVRETGGSVILDDDDLLITPSFHANCGGQTCSSESVWREKLPYLRSVRDDYCLQEAGARWSKRVALPAWRAFLADNGIFGAAPRQLEAEQPTRRKYYEVGDQKVELIKLRQRFALRSAFFDVHVVGAAVLLSGRGYGHGVGLCQEGAMQMAARGRSCRQIVQHYYRSTRIAPFGEAMMPFDALPDALPRLFNPWRGELPDTTTYVDEPPTDAEELGEE